MNRQRAVAMRLYKVRETERVAQYDQTVMCRLNPVLITFFGLRRARFWRLDASPLVRACDIHSGSVANLRCRKLNSG